jgi:8-oxo-dGTP pyrophosphatase MutT (NUDIX family)
MAGGFAVIARIGESLSWHGASADFSFENIRSRLAALPPEKPSLRVRKPKRAAVALVLRSGADDTEVLLIKRAERPGDPWSGQVAMPGGREEPSDTSLFETAVRETQEEVGVDLVSVAQPLGQLQTTRAMAKRRLLPMTITPFVFALNKATPVCLSSEASASFWLPLGLVQSGALDDRTTYRLGPVDLDLPCWRYEGFVVWGLTYQMLSQFISIMTA